MSCTRIALLALLLVADDARANAHARHVAFARADPTDTLVIASFTLYGGTAAVAGQPVTLQHRLVGNLVPSHFRVSRSSDFADAGWQPYPSTVPRWSSPTFDGSCRGAGLARLVAYFQVRAPRNTPPGTAGFVLSNVARDTACVFIGA